MFLRLLREALRVGLILTLSTGVASAESSEPTLSNAPFAIFGDETYRRDGALTKFRTCLAIADDPMVQSVWEDEAFAEARSVPAYDLVRTLHGLKDKVRLQRGFGTLLACAHVVSTWYSRTIGDDPDYPFRSRYLGTPALDGRFEHGATIVDLGLGNGLRAFIEPVALARILTSPGLLPKASFGGIIVRNAIVNGPLVMHNLHLTSPLAFVNVKFVGRRYSKELFDNPRRTEDTALAIAYSQFDHHVLIASSEICGQVNVKDSLFRETLAFERVTQKTKGCQPTATAPVPPYPKVSVWDQFHTLRAGPFLCRHASGSTFARSAIVLKASSRPPAVLDARLKLWENDIGTLQIDCSILARRALTSPTIRSRRTCSSMAQGNPARPMEGSRKPCDEWWLDDQTDTS